MREKLDRTLRAKARHQCREVTVTRNEVAQVCFPHSQLPAKSGTLARSRASGVLHHLSVSNLRGSCSHQGRPWTRVVVT